MILALLAALSGRREKSRIPGSSSTKNQVIPNPSKCPPTLMGSKTGTKPPLAPSFQTGSTICVTIRRLTLVHLRTPVLPYWSTKFMWFHDFGVKQTGKNASPPQLRPQRAVKVGQSPHLCIVFGQGVYKGEFQHQPCLEGCLGTLGRPFWQERKVQNSWFELDEKPSHPQSLQMSPNFGGVSFRH